MAIVGNGDIAKALKDRDGVTFFASGCSNSQEKRPSVFWREQDLLMIQPKGRCLVYFSTISKFYPSPSPYIVHKTYMEKIVKREFKNHFILSIGNIDFGRNPNTFINKMRAMKELGTPLPVKDEWKFMMTKEHLQMLTANIPPEGKHEICAFSYMALVKDLL